MVSLSALYIYNFICPSYTLILLLILHYSTLLYKKKISRTIKPEYRYTFLLYPLIELFYQSTLLFQNSDKSFEEFSLSLLSSICSTFQSAPSLLYFSNRRNKFLILHKSVPFLFLTIPSY